MHRWRRGTKLFQLDSLRGTHDRYTLVVARDEEGWKSRKKKIQSVSPAQTLPLLEHEH